MITIELTENEALVLYEWLARSETDSRPAPFEHKAEERVFFDIGAMLEPKIDVLFDPNYSAILDAARHAIVNPDDSD